jgi:hypothetical protein
MTFVRQEALDLCQTCGSGRPDFYRSGAYDPYYFWSIHTTPSKHKMLHVDKVEEKINIFHNIRMNKHAMGQKEAKLVSAVQTAQWC